MDSASSRRAQAKLFLDQGKTVFAAAVLIKLVEHDPCAENLNALADVYHRQGLFDLARDLYLRALQQNTPAFQQRLN
jgi:Tfp pilus assembly protein PilF